MHFLIYTLLSATVYRKLVFFKILWQIDGPNVSTFNLQIGEISLKLDFPQKLPMLLEQTDLLNYNKKKFGTHQGFLYDTPENWLTQVHFFGYTYNTQPLSHLHDSTTQKKKFETQPRIPLNYQLRHSRNKFREWTEQYCSHLPSHSHNKPTELNPLFHSILLKTFSSRFPAIETAVLQNYSYVYQQALEKISCLYKARQNQSWYSFTTTIVFFTLPF